MALGRQAVDYIHIILPRHQIVFVEGAPSESLYPGPFALAGLDINELAAIRSVLPTLSMSSSREDTVRTYGPPAREIARFRDLGNIPDAEARCEVLLAA